MWTREKQIEFLLALPWTVQAETTPEGDRLLRIAEIPSAVGSGETDDDLAADLWDSLRASLEAFLHFADTVPLPAGVYGLPWVVKRPTPVFVVGTVDPKGLKQGQINVRPPATSSSWTANEQSFSPESNTVPA